MSARIEVLGPLRLLADGQEVPLRGAKLRTLLTLLCLENGRTVSIESIRTVLWGEQPPLTADNAVQVYIATLRKLLPALGDPGIVLQTVSPGYRLMLPAGLLDRDDFLQARADAADAAAHDLHESASAHYRTALGLWRGPALGELAAVDGLAMSARELDRIELDTFEAFAENELLLERHRELALSLERRARQHPLRESLWALLALSLYRSELQSEALEALRTVRAALDEELGVEPGYRLRALETSILRHDPALLRPTAATASEADRRPAPSPASATWLGATTEVRSDLAVLPLRLELPDGTAIMIDRRSVLLGRDPGCDVVLAQPDVSARHARIITTVRGHLIEDLVSTNGTYVNGEPVTRQMLAPGDVLELGRMRVRYDRP